MTVTLVCGVCWNGNPAMRLTAAPRTAAAPSSQAAAPSVKSVARVGEVERQPARVGNAHAGIRLGSLMFGGRRIC